MIYTKYCKINPADIVQGNKDLLIIGQYKKSIDIFSGCGLDPEWKKNQISVWPHMSFLPNSWFVAYHQNTIINKGWVRILLPSRERADLVIKKFQDISNPGEIFKSASSILKNGLGEDIISSFYGNLGEFHTILYGRDEKFQKLVKERLET